MIRRLWQLWLRLIGQDDDAINAERRFRRVMDGYNVPPVTIGPRTMSVDDALANVYASVDEVEATVRAMRRESRRPHTTPQQQMHSGRERLPSRPERT